MKAWYEADTDLLGTGYSTCGHKHRKPASAKKCLPKTPKGNFSIRYINMANVRKYINGIEYTLTEDEKEHLF